MSGSKTALLTAFATPAQIAPMWDHTFVASDCGWIWRCWGNCSGGSPLVQGQGDSFMANCLSKPQGTAGIRYGKDGVCHQTANRILDPAGVKVTRARGYLTSFKFFKHYGSKPWTRQALCYGLTSASPEHNIYEALSVQRIAGQKDPIMATEDLSFMAYSISDEPEDFQERNDIRELCDPHLAEPLSDYEVEELQRIFIFARREQQSLEKQLEDNVLPPETYLGMMNGLTHVTADWERRLLGEYRFLRVFGEAGLQPEGLIDPEEFFASLHQDAAGSE